MWCCHWEPGEGQVQRALGSLRAGIDASYSSMRSASAATVQQTGILSLNWQHISESHTLLKREQNYLYCWYYYYYYHYQ